jgi:SAM-dependent methyltransferase
MAMPPVAPMVHHCCALLRQRLLHPETSSGLLVGCGSGDEVVYLRRTLGNARILGTDLETSFSALARGEKCVVAGDARHLPFNPAAFDFAAAFHSLEHVGDPQLALNEVCRVLRPGGWFYIGVPNKTRIVGYLGSFDASTWEKITWNLTDWWARLRGRFHYALGAHAGFERGELAKLVETRFVNVRFLTEEYIRFKYQGRLPDLFLDLLLAPRIVKYTAPAHYLICQKQVL